MSEFPKTARRNCPEFMELTDDDNFDWRIPCIHEAGHDGWHQDIAGIEWLPEDEG